MNPTTEHTKEKSVFLKSYPKIELIKNVINNIYHTPNVYIQISVLGKLATEELNPTFLNSKTHLQTYCENDLKLSSKFGTILNPEIGPFFIAGFLAPMFLQEVNGKTIGSMPTGLFGILSGLGINQNNICTHLRTLKKGNYILILRGSNSELNKLKSQLKIAN
ncbi:hypothetical protein [Winogradskyella wichelsiae]|uniref:hypothetical protein n=1 Tax=Winogradskyella wichelsiae TaxID=2697007 RepID=UPI0015CBA0B9|nr:hypothetical protein [Winogradskyella wichelsiae]